MFPNSFRPLTLVSAALLAVMIAPARDRSSFALMVDDAVSFERGGHHFITDLVALSDTEVYGVGFNGLVRFDGRAWKLVRAYTKDLHLERVAASGDKLMALDRYCQYVVIDRGAVELGEPIESPFPDCRAGDLKTDATGQFWFTGEIDGRGFIARWTGDTWIPVPIPETGRVTAIEFDGESHAWAFAEGVILEWEDGAWSILADAPAVIDPINAVRSDGPSNVWAVGGWDKLFSPEWSPTYVAMHFDGSRWEVVVSGTDYAREFGQFHDVVLTDDGRVLVAAGIYSVNEIRDGVLRRLYTLSWSALHSSEQFFGATRLPGGDVWFVGGLGAKVRYDGDVFSAVGGGRPIRWFVYGVGGPLARIGLTDDSLAWTVGLYGPPLVYDGDIWRDDLSAPEQLWLAAIGTHGRNAWFGSGLSRREGTDLWAWDGTAGTWRKQPTETSLPFVDIVSGPTGEMFAVASNIMVDKDDIRTDLLRLEGERWILVGTTDLAAAFTATVDPMGAVWLAGTSLLRWSDGDFERIDDLDPEFPRYWDVASNSSGMIAVAAARSVHVYKDGDWTNLGLTPKDSQDYFGAIAVGPDDSVWLSSRRGLFVWRDGYWGQVPLDVADPTDHLMLLDLAISHEFPYEVIGVGEFETIVRIDPSRLVTDPVAQPTGVATRPVYTPTPTSPPESGTKIHLPLAVRRVAPGS